MIDNAKTFVSKKHAYVLVLEACVCDFNALIKAHAGRDESLLWRFLYEAVEALTYAQEKVRTRQGVVHRDIKPANLLLGQDSLVRVADFGCSRHYIASSTDEYSVRGSDHYLSPLLLASKLTESSCNHNPYKSDVFSLGVTMLEMALGESSNCTEVLEGMEFRIGGEVRKLEGRYSREWINIISEMMRFDEENRPDFPQLQEKVRWKIASSGLSQPYWHTVQHCADSDSRGDSSRHVVLGPEAVQLDCGHYFCSSSCLCNYISNQEALLFQAFSPVFCPICYKSFPHSLLSAALHTRLQANQEVMLGGYKLISSLYSPTPASYRYQALHTYSQSYHMLTVVLGDEALVENVKHLKAYKLIATVKEEFEVRSGVKVFVREMYDYSLADYSRSFQCPEDQLWQLLRETAYVFFCAQKLVRTMQNYRPVNVSAHSIYIKDNHMLLYDFELVQDSTQPFLYRNTVTGLGAAFLTFFNKRESEDGVDLTSQACLDRQIPESLQNYSECLIPTLALLASGEIEGCHKARDLVEYAFATTERTKQLPRSFSGEEGAPRWAR